MRPKHLLLAVALVGAACGGSAADTTTTVLPTSAASTSGATTTATLATTTSAPATTQATTTIAPVDNAPSPELVLLAEQKTTAIESAIPDEYTFNTVADEDGAGDNELFTACLDTDDFDLNDLGDVSAAAFDIDLDAPEAGVFGAASGSVEVRVFRNEAVAVEAFATLEKILGTDAGRACLGQQLADFMAAEMGEGAEVSVAVEAGGLLADASTRLVVDIDASGIDAVLYWDLVASREGECTVFAVFQAFDEPFDQEIAAALLFPAFGG